ncbi:unnamed protein product [Closterium sp. NIES-54]
MPGGAHPSGWLKHLNHGCPAFLQYQQAPSIRVLPLPLSSHAPHCSHLGLSLCQSLSHGLGLSLPLFLCCLLQLHTPQQFCWHHHHPCGACGSPPAEFAAIATQVSTGPAEC